jgi:photosystem II stability/assembly factor-like uncharacterized protein
MSARSGHFLVVASLLLAFTAAPALASAPQALLIAGAQAGAALVVVGERGTILRSEDHAHTWAPAPSRVESMLTGLSFAPDSECGWAVGHQGVILATTDGGRTWQRQRPDGAAEDSFLDVLALDAQHIIAVGAYGLFAETHNGGTTWTTRRISETDFHLNRLTRAPGGALYLAGEAGTLLASTDQGATWQPLDSPYAGSLYGVTALDERTLVAYGLQGHIFRSDDAGATWTELPITSTGLVSSALPLRDGALVFAGSGRPLAISRDAARTLHPIDAPLSGAIAALLELPDRNLLTLGEAGARVVSLTPAP